MKKLFKITIICMAIMCLTSVVVLFGCKNEAPHSHTYTDKIIVPTCTERGYTTHTCECGESYIDSYVSAIDHSPKASVIENEIKADCTATGSYDEVIRCAVCNEIVSSIHKTTEKTGHNYKDGICSVCGDKQTVPHKHSYTESITAPTCTEKGYTTYYCACGDNYNDNYINANGHTPNAAIRENEVSASCTSEGSYDEIIRCSVCNEIISSTHKTIEKTQHTYIDGVCSACGDKQTVPHKHSYTESVTTPTCTEKGYTTYTCACGDSYKDNYVNAKGHTPNAAARENEIPATCISEGSYDEVVRCSVCNEIISSTHKTIEKNAHNYSNGVCSVCGVAIETESDFKAIGFEINNETSPLTFTKTVSNAEESINLINAFTVAKGCKWRLFKDSLGASEYPLKAMPLETGHNIAYVIVFYDNDSNYFTRYKLDIYRLHIREYKFINFDNVTHFSGTIEENFAITAPDTNPTKDYYEFSHWTDGNGERINFPYTVSVDSVFRAAYTPTEYSISYELNGGSLTTDKNSYTVEMEIALDIPVKEHYDFVGWCEKEDLSDTAITTLFVGNYGNKTFYAKWSLHNYSISYELDGGSLATDKNSYTVETEIVLDIPERIGYNFAGWYDNADFIGEPVTEITIGNYGDKTFYAKWSLQVYSISYELNGGSLTTDKNSYTVEMEIALDIPVKEHYDFVGWCEKENLSDAAITMLSVGNYGNKTFYAKWSLHNYSISYELNGGNIYGDFLTSFTVEDLPFALQGIPYKEGLGFDGWFADSDYNKSLSQITEVGDITVYVKWYIDYCTYTTYDETFYSVTGYTGSISEIRIPSVYNNKPVMGIGDSAFYGCSNLTSVIIPNSVTYIGNSAFEYCSGLTSVIIGNNVTSIGNSAFGGCVDLETVYWNATACESAGFFNYPIFNNCNNLSTVIIGENVISIPSYAFYGCSGLTDIFYNGDVASWCRIVGLDNLMESKYGSSKKLYIKGEEITELIIPNGVTSIGSSAFSGCSNLTSIIIPNSVTHIGNSAFEYCSGLTSITIPDSVTSIDSSAFNGCSGLTSITIPDSVMSISDYAFSGCSGLASITIPSSVKSIGKYAFSGCSGLTDIFYNGDITSWCKISGLNNLMRYGSSNKKLYINGEEITGELIIPNGVTSIPSSAFSGCSGLTSVTLPDSVKSIGDWAFYNCSELTSVTLPDSVTSIGSGAFSGCSGLTSVIIPDSVTSIGDSVFRGCSGLTSITIPDSVMNIGDSVFCDCSGLTSVTIGNSVSNIGNMLFGNCSSLISITLPDSITSISDFAFWRCSALKNVYYKGTAEDWLKISINTGLTNAERYYYSQTEPNLNADGTDYDGNYWHYDENGEIVVWKKENQI